MSSTRLDRIDMNILVELQKNGRITNAQLAEAVGLSPSPCLLRVKRLQKAGYITGYAAQINLKKLGSSVIIFLEVTLTQHKRENFQLFEASLRRHPEVVECHLISGGFDYLLKIVVKDLAHYQALVESLQDDQVGMSKYFSYIVVKTAIGQAEMPLRMLFEDE